MWSHSSSSAESTRGRPTAWASPTSTLRLPIAPCPLTPFPARPSPPGIVPYINASIILQLLSTTYPSLKKLQREEGTAGKEKYELYQKYRKRLLLRLPLCLSAVSPGGSVRSPAPFFTGPSLVRPRARPTLRAAAYLLVLLRITTGHGSRLTSGPSPSAVALGFALAQSIGQLTYLRPYVEDFSTQWFAGNVALLTGGAMALVYIAETIGKLKLGNGTSVLIFASIASSVPSSIGAAITQSAQSEDIGTGSLVNCHPPRPHPLAGAPDIGEP